MSQRERTLISNQYLACQPRLHPHYLSAYIPEVELELKSTPRFYVSHTYDVVDGALNGVQLPLSILE